MKHSIYVVAGCLMLSSVRAFQLAPTSQRPLLAGFTSPPKFSRSMATEQGNDAADASNEEAVGNLVADDEWEGLGMELSEIVRIAVIEDLKKKSRDFLGKEEYEGR